MLGGRPLVRAAFIGTGTVGTFRSLILQSLIPLGMKIKKIHEKS